jgi:hypothetical protein
VGLTLSLPKSPISDCHADRQSRFLAQSRTKKKIHLLIKIALLTWGIYYVNRCTEHSMLSKTHKKMIANQFSRSKVIDCNYLGINAVTW